MNTKKKIYIGGKVTGLPIHEASMKFGTVQKLLQAQGHTTIVPLDLVDSGTDWAAAMKICIAALVGADELYLLPNWSESRGAILERDIALRLSIPITYGK